MTCASPPAKRHAPHYPISGWIEAGLYVFAIAFLSLAYVVGHRLGAHPIAFVLYAMLVSALVLLAATGPGPDAVRIILAPQSWLVGAGTIGMEIFYYLLLEKLSPAEGSLLVRLSIPLSLIVGWALFARRPRAIAWVGGAVIVAGLLPLLFLLDPAYRPAVADGRCRLGLRLQPARLLGRVPSVEPARPHAHRKAAHHRPGRARHVFGEPGAGRRLRAAGRARRAAADTDGADGGANAARADHPARRAGRRRHPDGDGVPELLLRGEDHDGELRRHQRLHAGRGAARASRVAAAFGLIPFFRLDASLYPAMAVVIAGVFMMLYGARRR